jgi:hypothetical protein
MAASHFAGVALAVVLLAVLAVHCVQAWLGERVIAASSAVILVWALCLWRWGVKGGLAAMRHSFAPSRPFA